MTSCELQAISYESQEQATSLAGKTNGAPIRKRCKESNERLEIQIAGGQSCRTCQQMMESQHRARLALGPSSE